MLTSLIKRIDWILVAAVVPLVGMGLVTMNSFVGENYFFERQLVWVLLGFGVFLVFSHFDWRFLRRTWVVVALFLMSVGTLLLVLVIGEVVLGAQSRFHVGAFAVQPADPIKLVTIILLAKYFSRRHVEIAHFKHIFISGLYVLVPAFLIFVQPDFGSAIILLLIWLGMIFASGISKKHLLAVVAAMAVAAAGMWLFALEDYQQQRILTFIHPYTDIQGAGYNAYQSTIAVGSGEVFGKGVGFGTQSRLQFLPEYETDFIFAAFAEEWGFIGVLLLLTLFGIVVWRVLANAMHGATNFEMLFGIGVAVLFVSHFVVHVGMNIGLLPVTGTTVPFLSYGGSHLITEFVALGMLMGMRWYGRSLHRDDMHNEFVGV